MVDLVNGFPLTQRSGTWALLEGINAEPGYIAFRKALYGPGPSVDLVYEGMITELGDMLNGNIMGVRFSCFDWSKCTY